MASQQHPVEVIMARGFIATLTTPAFLVDGVGNMIFFNESAGELLGVRYEDAGSMAPADWGGRFSPSALDGGALSLEQLPLTIALSRSRPAHSPMRIRSATGKEREIEVTAFPILGRSGSHGAIAIFWDRLS